jgi:alkanesulfonate monooxygenase SsuD/methylene tetrahydromethanopterin reductase-like flavin-dependent oxidoreductase (luciferase family)
MTLRYGVFLPPFGELVDPRTQAALAAEAEGAGWDGYFVWDHVVRVDDSLPVSDPYVVLAAIACATTRMVIGPLITPLARRRPWVVARQTVTLDHLSGGRLVLGVGLGNDNGRELSAFGEELDPVARGRLLDESLEVLTRLWSGARVTHSGLLTVDGVRFLPTPLDRIPLWVGGSWPNKPPLRRAARYDGMFPIGEAMRSPSDVAELVAAVRELRGDVDGFDVVLHGRDARHEDGTPADFAGLAEAGATWWLEALQPTDTLAQAYATITAGPPGR